MVVGDRDPQSKSRRISHPLPVQAFSKNRCNNYFAHPFQCRPFKMEGPGQHIAIDPVMENRKSTLVHIRSRKSGKGCHFRAHGATYSLVFSRTLGSFISPLSRRDFPCRTTRNTKVVGGLSRQAESVETGVDRRELDALQERQMPTSRVAPVLSIGISLFDLGKTIWFSSVSSSEVSRSPHAVAPPFRWKYRRE